MNDRRICILGGGFGGLYTALRLDELPWEGNQKPEIVLIDRNDRFLFSPLLYELVSGEMQTWEVAPPFAEILADTSIIFDRANVSEIDIQFKQIKRENSPAISYDKLVIAMGGTTPLDLVPGAREYAIPFRTLQDAYQLEEKLRLLEQSKAEKIRIAVIGGGYSGVELVCKLADRLGEKARLRLVERTKDILFNSPKFNREAAKKALEQRKVWLDLETEVDKIEAETISLLYKGQIDTIPVDLVLWTVGTKGSDLIRSLPLQKNQRGMLCINDFLQTVDRQEIYALGDVAEGRDATDRAVPPTAQVAIQQADYCAWNIWASLTGKPLLPFRYQPLGEMMALGNDNATISGLGLQLDGTMAYLLRRLVYLYRLPNWKHKLTVGLNWITQPLIDLL